MLTLDDIKQLIPHRNPFLWLDEVVEISDDRIHARKHISPDLAVFQGHYPDFPVLPGVLLCESAFQAAAVLIARSLTEPTDKVPVVTRQNNTQFRRMVRPGETTDIHVRVTERLGGAVFFAGTVRVDGQVAVRLEFAAALAGGKES